jgi:hypothetical protein
MSNIWADTFSAIREPFFEEKKEKEEPGEKKHKEGPAEEKAEDKKGEKETEDDNPKRWWDDDGDGKGYEKGEVEGKFKKKVKKEETELDENRMASRMGTMPSSPAKVGKATHSIKDLPRLKEPSPEEKAKARKALKLKETQKEERELSSKTDKNDKLDVRKGIHNKINTKPTVSEEVEAWVDELLSEGYDLSEFTWDEVSEIYESTQTEEGNTYGMSAKGDVERQKVDPLSSAKAKAARAKVTKERADFQVAQQAQRLKVNANEAVLQFVSGRTELFEGVYDPKKSKMRSASERTKNAMTDAQRKAAKKESERTSEIHSKGETVLAGLRSSGKKGKVQTTAAPKAAAPAANRQVKGKYDKLAKAADNILKGLKDK